jgi:hypothetical protein
VPTIGAMTADIAPWTHFADDGAPQIERWRRTG